MERNEKDKLVEQNREIAKVFYERFQKRDWEGMKSLFGLNYKYHLAGNPVSTSDTQKQRLFELHEGFPELSVIVHRVIADKDNAAVIFTIEGVHNGSFVGIKSTGKKIHVASVGFFRFENGKISEYSEIFHLLRLLEQIGELQPLVKNW